jgi:phosphatidylserine/phosphatidylglycerophosphate/cardiolipin synthase-like enzyme
MSTDPETRLSFDGVSADTLRTLAAALRNGRLSKPLTAFKLSTVSQCPAALVADLQRLSEEGISSAHLALLLETSAEVAEARLVQAEATELVWTGPESTVSHSRDTAVVVEELFASATRSVLVSTFAIQQGQRVFAPLAARLDALPELSARLFVHVGREWKDTREDSELLREFAHSLASRWPGTRRPGVFYDPRTLSTDPGVRASWHAKCVLVDDEVAFVTSANFTEWAQQRNVEAGVLVRSRDFARQLRAQFDSLVQVKAVRRLPEF